MSKAIICASTPTLLLKLADSTGRFLDVTVAIFKTRNTLLNAFHVPVIPTF